MAATKSGPAEPFTQEQIDDCLTALVAFAGNAAAAVRYLKGEGKRTPTSGHLQTWARTLHWQRYEEFREKFATQREQTVAANFRDAAQRAGEVAMLAVEKAETRLKNDKDENPAQTAANLARVAQSSTDKLLSLTGRPTQITETRDVAALVRSLRTRGVEVAIDGVALAPDDEPKELPPGEASSDGGGG